MDFNVFWTYELKRFASRLSLTVRLLWNTRKTSQLIGFHWNHSSCLASTPKSFVVCNDARKEKLITDGHLICHRRCWICWFKLSIQTVDSSPARHQPEQLNRYARVELSGRRWIIASQSSNFCFLILVFTEITSVSGMILVEWFAWNPDSERCDVIGSIGYRFGRFWERTISARNSCFCNQIKKHSRPFWVRSQIGGLQSKSVSLKRESPIKAFWCSIDVSRGITDNQQSTISIARWKLSNIITLPT